MIKIYGSPKSSSGRCFWCLEEIGVEYEPVPVDFRAKEHKSEDYLKINPNGKVPALIDDDFVMWESMAINFYLASAYKQELLGSNAHEHGHVHQWSIWAMTDLQPPMIEAFIQLVFVPEERRDYTKIEKAMGKLPQMFKTLDEGLAERNVLVGDSFTLADLNVASVVTIAEAIKFDLDEYKNIQRWLQEISERESFKRYQKLCQQ